MLRDPLAEREIDPIGVVDERAAGARGRRARCEDLDLRLGGREALLDLVWMGV